MTRAEEVGKLSHMALKTVPGKDFGLRKRKKLIKAWVLLHLQPMGEGAHACKSRLYPENRAACVADWTNPRKSQP